MYETYEELSALPSQRINDALKKLQPCTSCMRIKDDGLESIERVRALCRKCVGVLEKELAEEVDKIRRRKKSHFYMNSGLLKFSTTHSFKGLESKVAFYLLTTNDDPELAYTTLTRAVEHLVVIDLSENNEFEEFFKANMTLA
ncbi:hypothetical protein [Thiocapsa imhoffii]|nr:hypothetical protein [Thiocapsa imhoffii]